MRSSRPLLPLGAAGLLALTGCKPDTDCPPGSSWDPVNEWCVLDDAGADDTGLDGGETGGESGSGEDSGSGGDDTGDPVEWLEVPDDCTAPSGLGEEPLSMTGELRYLQESFEDRLVELVDISIDAERDVVYGTGQGGFFIWDISNPAEPVEELAFPVSGGHARFHKSARYDDTIYLTHRDDGLFTMRYTGSDLDEGGMFRTEGVSALRLVDDTLFVSTHSEVFAAMDITGGAQANEDAMLGMVEAYTSAWDFIVVDGLAYVADATMGLVIIDVSDPTDMSVLGSLDLGLGAQDVAVHEGVAYLAVGAAGIAAVDVSAPESPALLGFTDYGSAVQAVAVDASTELLWAVNQEAVLVLDVSTPAEPLPLDSHKTEQWAMHVDAGGGYAYVGDWNLFSTWTVDTSVLAPDADANPSEVFVREEGETFEVELSNRGGATLEIAGMSIAQEGFSILADRLSVEPGETARVQVTWEGGAEVDTTLCIASNDPGAPTQELELHSGSGGSHIAIGKDAPDFTLVGLDGDFYTLSEQLGHPVVLVYFATW